MDCMVFSESFVWKIERSMSKGKRRGSSHADRHHYLRPELWADGTLAFYLNSSTHVTEKYMDFHHAQVKAAGRLLKIN